MRKPILLISRFLVVACAVLCTLSASAAPKENGRDGEQRSPRRSRATRLEMLGDRSFINNDYEQAMRRYERSAQRVENSDRDEWLRMQLKMGRLYSLLQQPEKAVDHFRAIYTERDTLLEVDDACTFIDVLRRLNMTQEAEVVARHYAFRTPYSRNQRYLNTLNALSNQHHYYGKGDSDFAAILCEASGPKAEYWLGEWDGQMFCAASGSQMLDPRKIFFHRTEYFAIDEQGRQKPLETLPREVQNGAAAYSEEHMVVTGINYRGNDRIHGVDVQELFRTQLFHSAYDAKRNRWSALMPLFEHQEEACYGHPVLLDEGRTLLFSSDREGGFGGMDLYMSHWDADSLKWSDPVNLGGAINTEGDEIFPNVLEENLYFASNGHEGYGGYDIYRVNFSGGRVLPGSLWHFPYPVNSVWNDYGLYMTRGTGYFISDRRGLEYKDDLYMFDNAETSLSGRDAVGVSQERLAMRGDLTQVEGLENSGMKLSDNASSETAVYMKPAEGEVLLTLYYDFDRWELTAESRRQLDALAANPMVAELGALRVLGYADEIGRPGYNQSLSERRAEQVAEYLVKCGIRPKVQWEGRGKTSPDFEDYRAQLAKRNLTIYGSLNTEIIQQPDIPLRDRIALNRTARRVDILVKTK